MSSDPEQEYFADGMVEDIITGLSRIRWLFVIARNSSFVYKGGAVDVKQVGRELGVRYVLEGSVRKAGDRVRITAQLIEAETGSHLWAERYDRLLDDIFDAAGRDHHERGRRHRAEPAQGRDRARQAQAPGQSRRLRPRAAGAALHLQPHAARTPRRQFRCSRRRSSSSPTTRRRTRRSPGAITSASAGRPSRGGPRRRDPACAGRDRDRRRRRDCARHRRVRDFARRARPTPPPSTCSNGHWR